MCTQIRVRRSSMRSAEIASSKSRAVVGSIVNVVRPVRSRRATSAVDAVVARLLGRPLDGGIEAPAQAAVEHERLEDVGGDVGAPERADELGVPAGPRLAATDEHEVADRHARVALEHHPAAALEERLGDEEAPALVDGRHDPLGGARLERRARRACGGGGAAAAGPRARLRRPRVGRLPRRALRGSRGLAALAGFACLPPPFVVTFADRGLPPPSASS